MDQVEEIKDKIDIVEFINERVALKKAGRNYKARCPFHQEKTPSFFVNPERQIWYCFGACDTGGDVISFLQKWENLEFIEALRVLAASAGVKLTSSNQSSEKARRKQFLLEINHLASEYYHYLLSKHAVGETARNYLQARGINKKTAKTFNLGYAPNSWNALGKYLLRKGYNLSQLKTAGIVIVSSKSGAPYDRFRGRLVFPLKDHRGNIVGFSGRKLAKDVGTAKYINTPETEIYHKRQLLYGLDITGKAIRTANAAILVEGEFDVLSSFQIGINNIVAVKGSGLTEEQLNLLKRYAQKLIFALDADTAGAEAIRRGVLLADEQGLDVYVLPLQKGKDPDELIRKNPNSWRQAVKQPLVYFEYMLDYIVRRYGTETAYAKRSIIEELAAFFARLTNPIVKAHYVKKLATKLALAEEIVSQSIQQAEKKIKLPYRYPLQSSFQQKKQVAKKRWQLLTEYILSLIIQTDSPQAYLKTATEILPIDRLPQYSASQVMLKLKQYLKSSKTWNVTRFIGNLPKQLQAVADKAYLADLRGIEKNGKQLAELRRAVRELRILLLRSELETTIAQMRKLEQSASSSSRELVRLNKKIAELSHAIHKAG